MLQSLQTQPKVVGVKQSLKALREGRAASVFLADDAEDKVRQPVLLLCQETKVSVTAVDTMDCLGKACGIDIGAAVAVILLDT